jgi:hypothetical protein
MYTTRTGSSLADLIYRRLTRYFNLISAHPEIKIQFIQPRLWLRAEFADNHLVGMSQLTPSHRFSGLFLEYLDALGQGPSSSTRIGLKRYQSVYYNSPILPDLSRHSGGMSGVADGSCGLRPCLWCSQESCVEYPGFPRCTEQRLHEWFEEWDGAVSRGTAYGYPFQRVDVSSLIGRECYLVSQTIGFDPLKEDGTCLVLLYATGDLGINFSDISNVVREVSGWPRVLDFRLEKIFAYMVTKPLKFRRFLFSTYVETLNFRMLNI